MELTNEHGPLPDRYQLQEMPTDSYPARTEQNVIDSDGTLIISHGPLTGDSEYTHKNIKKHQKPCLHIDLGRSKLGDSTVNRALFEDWVGSGNPDMNEAEASKVIIEVLWRKVRETHRLRAVE